MTAPVPYNAISKQATNTAPPDAEPIPPLVIYGESDDLVEVRGYITREFYAIEGAELVVTDPTGARLWVVAEFCTVSLREVHDGWMVGVQHADPEWTHPVSFGPRPDRPDEPALFLSVPAGTTVTEWQPS